MTSKTPQECRARSLRPRAYHCRRRGGSQSADGERPDRFYGTLEQIAEDITAARKLGAAEIVIYPQFSSGDRDGKRYRRSHGKAQARNKAKLMAKIV
jgi:hypothetical protein